MGQAKLRGTPEQRQAEGITKREAADARRKAEAAAREAALTPEQRARRRQVQRLMGVGLTLAQGRY